MNEREAKDAVVTMKRVALRWANGKANGVEGRVIAYCHEPQVLIETDDGERVWYRADLTEEVRRLANERNAPPTEVDGAGGPSQDHDQSKGRADVSKMREFVLERLANEHVLTTWATNMEGRVRNGLTEEKLRDVAAVWDEHPDYRAEWA